MLKTQAEIKAPIQTVWGKYTDPLHVVHWNFASPEWHCPHAEGELKKDAKFSWRMEARDGSFGFDFSGTYTLIKEFEAIDYTMDDGRKAEIRLNSVDKNTFISVSFEAESENPQDMQQAGWQLILANFKAYCEQK